MFRILIIEDDTNKLRNVLSKLNNISDLDVDSIEHSIDALDAKRKLRTQCYDLMIVDIAIPQTKSSQVDLEGGIDLVDEILQRKEIYKTPTHIIGLTSKDEVFHKAFEKFNNKTLTVIRYSDIDEEWETQLTEGIIQRMESKKEIDSSPIEFDYDIAFITALAEPELSQVKALCTKWDKVDLPRDSTIYYTSKINQNGKDIKIVAAHAPQMGMCAASTLTMKLIENFHPRYIVMTGIAAGVKDGDNINLGDILIAEEVWDGASGKIKTNEKDEYLFLPDFRHKVLNDDIKNIIQNIKLERRYLDDIYGAFPLPTCRPKTVLNVHIGPMASVPAVIQNKDEIDKIKSHSRKLIGIEMEAYGVFYSAANSMSPKPIAISIKSVCDFADEHKSDNYQEYSAYTSAQFAFRLLLNELISKK